MLSWKRDGLSPALPFMLRGPKDASGHPHASVSPCERVCVGGTPQTSSVLSGKLRRVLSLGYSWRDAPPTQEKTVTHWGLQTQKDTKAR